MVDHSSSVLTRSLAGLRRLVVSWVFALALALGAGAVAVVNPLGAALDQQLQSWRASLHPRQATGDLVLVEIDARSLAAYRAWPWPRERFAAAIRALERQGASMAAFDIDFSAASSPAQDAALAQAIAQTKMPVILPTFRQASSQTGSDIVENLPLPALSSHAQLAAVNIFADADGLVRSYPYGTITQGIPRPAIGAMLADANGAANTAFPIDTSLDPASVPHVSFVDLAEGRLPAHALRGKRVLIGGTAIELGDRYAVAGRGILSGPMIQLLAAETLRQGTAPVDRGSLVPLLIAFVCMGLVLRRARARWPLILLATALILALPLASEMLRLGSFSVAPALAVLAVFWAARAMQSALASARLAQQSDAATGLPNARALALLPLAPAATLVVLRIDRFGEITNVVGHDDAAGLVLRIAERLSYTADSAIHRLSEGALGWHIDTANSEELAQRIDAAAAMLRSRFEVGGRSVELVCGFGTAPAAQPQALAKAMLAADRALARAARWVPHCAELDEEAAWNLTLPSEIETAMREGHLWVAYQPKLDIKTRRICGAEALVRWEHPTRGPQFPDSFIPLLEASGRIGDLTLFVLERALQDRRAWAAQGLDIHVAVNVSAYFPAAPDFVARLQAVLARYPDDLAHLTLEVTESGTMADPEQTVAGLHAICALGPSLSIDDYGTGQSTLSYLKRLPAREIKIDKSFVLGMEANASDRAMVRSSIALAQELGFAVVAEGVENLAILDMLAGFGCDVAQGWHIGRPAPARDMLVTAHRLAA